MQEIKQSPETSAPMSTPVSSQYEFQALALCHKFKKAEESLQPREQGYF